MNAAPAPELRAVAARHGIAWTGTVLARYSPGSSWVVLWEADPRPTEAGAVVAAGAWLSAFRRTGSWEAATREVPR